MPNAESLMFDYETTSRTDYRKNPIEEPVKTEYKPKRSCYRIRPAPLKGIHSLVDWNGPRVPFNLYFKRKDVVRQNPWEPQTRFDKPIDHEREHVQKTRPSFVMTPASKLDVVEEPTRSILIKGIYTTSTEGLMKEPIELAAKKINVKAPLPLLPAPSNPIVLAKLQPPLVSPEWRMDSVSWDNRSHRAYTDATKEFWLRRAPPKCRVCDESATIKAQRKMKLKPKQ